MSASAGASFHAESFSARRFLWRVIGRPLFRMTYHNWNPVRRFILRLFGATLDSTTKLRNSVMIDCPWNLSAGRLTVIGDAAVLRTKQPVTIGERCVISQYAMVTSFMRDPYDEKHRVTAAPITIEDDCWVATDALVLPGSKIHAGTVVGARSLVDGELPGWSIATGEPAEPRAARELKADSTS